MLKKATTRFEKRLQELHEGLSRPSHPQEDRGDLETDRTAESPSEAERASMYDIEVMADKSGEQATAIKWQQRPICWFSS